jgi:hypothetical protein
MKFCKICHLEKDEISFDIDRNQCKDCRKIYNKKYKQDNKEKLSHYNKQYHKQYQKDNKSEISKYMKNYHKQYYDQNIDDIKAYNKQYRQDNKERLLKRDNLYTKKRKLADPQYKLRKNISRTINYFLHGKKRGKSILKYIPYTVQNLKEHLEKQFEPWMNWNNYGKASINKRTWQIDHIVPQSKLLYSSMEEGNFKKCWALENLRPLEAFENIKRGNK